MNVDAELYLHVLPDSLAKCHNLLTRRATFVDEDEGLF